MKATARRLQKEQTRQLLLKTAYEVFSQRGIMNTRMSDIAQAAGVSHGTVFVHFQTQEALIEQVTELYARKIALRTHELAEGCGRLEELLRAHVDGIMEFEPFYTRLVIENRLIPSGARDNWVSIQSAISFHFSRAAQRDLKFLQDKDIPAYMVFNLWIGLVHYYLANADLFAPEGSVLRRYGETLIENFMKLLPVAEEETDNG